MFEAFELAQKLVLHAPKTAGITTCISLLTSSLVLWSKGVPEVVLRDLASKDHPRDAGEVVMQACPESCIDNLVTKIVRHLEMPYGI
jgi:hypothetical protein